MTEELEEKNRNEQTERDENESPRPRGWCSVCDGTGRIPVQDGNWRSTIRCAVCNGKGRLHLHARGSRSWRPRLRSRIGGRGGGRRPFPPQRWPVWSRGVECGFYPDLHQHVKRIREMALVEVPKLVRKEKPDEGEIDEEAEILRRLKALKAPGAEDRAPPEVSFDVTVNLADVGMSAENAVLEVQGPVEAETAFGASPEVGYLQTGFDAGPTDVRGPALDVAEPVTTNFGEPVSQPAVDYLNSVTPPLATQIDYDVAGMDVVGGTGTAPLEPQVPLDIIGFSSNTPGG